MEAQTSLVWRGGTQGKREYEAQAAAAAAAYQEELTRLQAALENAARIKAEAEKHHKAQLVAMAESLHKAANEVAQPFPRLSSPLPSTPALI